MADEFDDPGDFGQDPWRSKTSEARDELTPTQEELRRIAPSFEDPRQSARTLQERVVAAMARNFSEPVELPDKRTGDTLSLELVGGLEAEEVPDPYDFEKIHASLMRGQTYGFRVKGRFRVVGKDKDGNVKQVYDDAEVTLARVPTPVYDRSYVVKGKKRHLANQFRRRPGVFTLQDAKGDFVTEFNVDPQSPSKVKNFRVWLDRSQQDGPEFRVTYGTAKKIPAWDIAKLMGASERDLEKQVGKDTAAVIASRSSQDRYESSVRQMHRSVLGDSERAASLPLSAAEEELREQLESTGFDPEVMALTTGKKEARLSKDVFLRSFGKTQALANEDIEPDDRESLILKRVMSPADLLAESVGRDWEVKEYRRQLAGQLRKLRSVAQKDPTKASVRQVLGNKLSPKIEARLTSSMLQRSDTATNPMENWANSNLTTIMGEGAIQSDKAVPVDAQLLNPSHLGFLDPVHSPDCFDGETEVYTKEGWVAWPDVTDATLFACRIDGRLEFHPAEKLHRGHYRGPMYGARSRKIGYLVTPNHRLWCRSAERRIQDPWKFRRPEDVHGRTRLFDTAHEPFIGEEVTSFDLPVPAGGVKDFGTFDPGDWAEFMGWWLSEGSLLYDPATYTYITRIHQSASASPEEYAHLEGFLARLPGSWSATGDGKSFCAGGKQLADYLLPFGKAQEKWLPSYFLSYPISARRRLLDALLRGDGRTSVVCARTRKRYDTRVYTTTSRRLAEGVEQLGISLGYAVSTHSYPDHREERYLDVYEVRLLSKREWGVSHRPLKAKTVEGELSRFYGESQFYTVDFDGEVYCATVPGGLLYVRRGTTVGHWSGNSDKGGVSLHHTARTRVVPDATGGDVGGPETGSSKLVSSFIDKKGAPAELSPADLRGKVVGAFDQFEYKDGKPVARGKKVLAFRDGKPVEVKAGDVDYWMPDLLSMFDTQTALIPFANSTQGNRSAYSSKQTAQGVPLVDREAPLVQIEVPGAKHTLEELFAEEAGAIRAKFDGEVVDVVDGGPGERTLIVRRSGEKATERISLPKNLPMGGSTPMDSDVRVQKGQKFKRGDLLADSIFTKDGVLATGLNMRTAYLPYFSETFEDATVMSETAAERMRSAHLYTVDVRSDKVRLGKKAYSSRGEPLPVQQWKNLDDKGVVKVGTRVKPGDPLVVGVRGVALADKDLHEKLALIGQFGTRDKRTITGQTQAFSQIWKEEKPGEVIAVDYRKGKDGRVEGARVTIRSDAPLQAGDKIYGRHGNKGVVGRVLPDAEMPRLPGKVDVVDPAGSPYRKWQEITEEEAEAAKKKYPGLKTRPATVDLVLNPLGVPGRLNPSQNYETLVARIAAKKGAPEKIRSFGYVGDDSNWDYVSRRLKEEGLDEDTEVILPSGRALPSVGVGYQYVLKAQQTAAKKNSARGLGTFQKNGLLARGDVGGRQLGELGVYGLLAQDAREFLRDAQLYKSENREEVWEALRSGRKLGDAGLRVNDEPLAFKRMLTYLRAAGVEPEHDPGKFTYRLRPQTDDDVLKLTQTALGGGKVVDRRIEDPVETVDAKGRPRPGGLFDPKVTGGMNGRYWTRFELDTKVPNPIYEKAIQELTGTKPNEYADIVAGRKAVDLDGEQVWGVKAVETMLDRVDLDKAYAEAMEEARTGNKSTDRSRAYRKLRSIKMLRDNNMTPTQAFMRQQVPVVPESIRTIDVDDRGQVVVGDLNYLYRDIAMTNAELVEAKKRGLPPEAIGQLEAGLYESMRTLMQVQGSKPLSPSGQYQGVLGTLSAAPGGGNSDVKRSFFKSQVFQRRQAFSAGAVLAADDSLGLDQASVPKGVMAALVEGKIEAEWRRMNPTAKPADRAEFTKRLKDYYQLGKKDPEVDEILRRVAKDQPVIVKRDPVLHKYGIQAFNAVLSDNKTLGLNPLVFGGFNADSVLGDVFVQDSGGLRVVDVADFPREGAPEVRESGVSVYRVPDGVSVPTFVRGRIEQVPVTEFQVHPDCVEWEIELSDGQVIQMAPTHSVAAASLTECRVEAVDAYSAEGRWVPSVRWLPSLDGAQWPPVPPGLRAARTEFTVPPLSEDAGWWVGATAGDGWVSTLSHLHLSFGADGEAVAREWERLGGLWIGSSPSRVELPHVYEGHECLSYRTSFHSSAAGRWMRECIGIGSYGKRLPAGFLSLPEQVRRGLLCGLIDTDGCVSLSARGQYVTSFATQSHQLAQDVRLLAMSLRIYATVGSSSRKGREEYGVHFCARDVWAADLPLRHPDKRMRLSGFRGLPQPAYSQLDRVPLPRRVRKEILSGLKAAGATRKADRNSAAFSCYVTLKRCDGFVPRAQLALLEERIEITRGIREWLDFVGDETVRWTRVVSAAATGRTVTMYDLKVPGPYTFAMASGAIVWDSDGDVLGIFAPLTEEANREAKEKLLPSLNLFNPSSGELEYTLGHESVLGLARLTRNPRKQTTKSYATLADAKRAWESGELDADHGATIGGKRTTLGREMFSDALPAGVTFDNLVERGVIDESGLDVGVSKKAGNLPRLLKFLATEHTNAYGEAANALRQIGQKEATYSGASLTLQDLKPILRDERKRTAEQLRTELDAIRSKRGLTPGERQQEVESVFGKHIRELGALQERVWSDGLKKERPDTLPELVLSGARATKAQLQQMLTAPVALVDGRNQVVDQPVMRNYSEGLDATGFWSAANGARMGAINKVIQVREPGFLTKQIVNTSIDQVVTEEDCGTSRYVELNANDPTLANDLVGRVLARPVRADKLSLPQGHALSQGDVSELHRKLRGDEPLHVRVRSPLRCEAESGVCQKCAGYDPVGSPFSIGTNVGVQAAQALGERSTQLTLSTFHSGGAFTPGKGTATNLYTMAQSLLRMPSSMGGKPAVVFGADATVKEVRPNRAKGGWDIVTEEDDKPNAFIPRKYRAPWETKETHEDRPKSIPDYFKPGMQLRRGDVLTDGMASPKEILRATGDIGAVQDYMSSRLHGLFAREGIMRRNIETVVKSMTDIAEVVNPAGTGLLPRQRITRQQAEKLRRETPGFTYRPVLRGVDVAPRERTEDWMSRLNFNRIRDVITESAQIGAESNYHTTNPIPALAVGRQFNRPPTALDKGTY